MIFNLYYIAYLINIYHSIDLPIHLSLSLSIHLSISICQSINLYSIAADPGAGIGLVFFEHSLGQLSLKYENNDKEEKLIILIFLKQGLSKRQFYF